MEFEYRNLMVAFFGYLHNVDKQITKEYMISHYSNDNVFIGFAEIKTN